MVLGTVRALSGASDSSWSGNITILNSSVGSVAAAAGRTLTITGNITAVSSTAATLLKLGEGTVEIGGSGNNTYVGVTYVQEGTLRLAKTAGNAFSGALVIGDDIGTDVVELANSDQIVGTVSISSSGLLSLGSFEDAISTLSMRIGNGQAAQVDTGTGRLILTAASNFVDLLPGANATASIGGNGTLSLGVTTTAVLSRTWNIADGTNPVDLDISAAVGVEFANPFSISVIKAGAGALQFSGSADNSYDGNTTVNEGTLILAKDDGVLAIAGGNVTVGNNIVLGNTNGARDALVISGGNEQIADTANITVNSGSISTDADVSFTNLTMTAGEVVATNADLNIGGTISITGGSIISTGTGAINFGGNAITSVSAPMFARIAGMLNLSNTTTVTVANNAAIPYDLEITADITGVGQGLIKAGAGTLLLSGDNTFDGGVSMSGSVGTTAIGSNTALGTGTLALASIANSNNLILQSQGAARTVDNSITLTGNHTSTILTFGGFNDLQFTSAGGLELTQARTYTVLNVGTTLTFDGPISQDVSRALVKSGRGTLVLKGNNTYQGVTTVGTNGGVLILEGTNTSTGTATAGEFGTIMLRDNGALGSITALTAAYGASIQIDNSAIDNSDRLPSVLVTLTNAHLEYLANAAGSSETLGALTIAGDLDSTLHLISAGGGSALTFSGLTSNAIGDRESLAIRSTGATIGNAGTDNQLIFTAAPTLTGGIVSRARVIDSTGVNFATHAGVGTPITVAPFATDINTPGGNVKIVGGTSQLTMDNTINALLLVDGGHVSEDAAHMLTISSGYIAAEGGSNDVTVTDLRFGATGTSAGIVIVNSDLALNANIATTSAESLSKSGLGELTLTGTNAFTGRVRVNQGGLIAASDLALGAGTPAVASQTLVVNRAYLVFEGNRTISDEYLSISGTGFLGNQTGALQARGGDTTWGSGDTGFARAGNLFIGVEDGRELILQGDFTGTTQTVGIVGGGTVEFGGSTDNTFTSGVTTIFDGTLRLNKSLGAASVGNVTIGDGLGGDNADRLVLGSAGQATVAGNRTFTIQPSGYWDLAGHDFTLTHNLVAASTVLVMNVGPNYSSDVNLNGANLTLTRNEPLGQLLTSTILLGGSSTASPPATISNGTLTAGGTNGVLNITANAGASDFEISALLSGAFQKSGTGGLALLADNTGMSAFQLNGGTVIVGDDGALGTGIVTISATAIIQGDDDVTLRTIANAIEFTSAAATTFTVGNAEGRAPITFTGTVTNTNTLARTFTLQNSATTFTQDIDLGNSTILTINTQGSASTPAGNITTFEGDFLNLATTLTKGGNGILVANGTSSHSGVLTVTGIMRVSDAGIFGDVGSTLSRTVVNANSSLELYGGINVGNEFLQINLTTALLNSENEGFTDGFPTDSDLFVPGTQVLRGIGSLRSMTGNNTWGTGATEFRLGGATSDIFVDAASSLVLNANVIGSATVTVFTGTNQLIKLGEGSLTLAGTTSNSYTGQTSVLEGTLVLDKDVSFIAVNGTLLVGDGFGTDTVVLNEDEQVINSAALIVHYNGAFNLNGFAETVVSLTLGLGENSSASVTGGSEITVNGALVVPVDSRANALSAPVTIVADYNLGAANRVFTVADSPAGEELVINGAIAATGLRAVTKNGFGQMRFTGGTANSYGGTTVINQGTLVLDKGTNVIAVPGALTVGNAIGEQDDDRLVSLFTGQLAGTGTTTVQFSGFLDLTDTDNAIGALTTAASLNAGSHIELGTTGTLALGGTLTTNSGAGIIETGAIINGGVLDLGGSRTLAINGRATNVLDNANELQVIDLGGATAGTFNIIFEGHTSADIDFDAPIATVQTALRALNTIGANVTVLSPAPGVYYVFFHDGLGRADVSQLMIDGSGLTGGAPTVSTRHDGFETIELTLNSQATNSPTLSKTGTGALLLNNSANDFDSTAFSAGYLFIGDDNAAGTGTLTVTGAASFRAFGGDRELNNPVSVGTTLQFTGANTLTMSGPFTLTGDRSFFVADPNATAIIEGAVGQSGTRQFTKIGAGTLLLNNTNTYTGDTNVNAGTLGGTGSIAATLRVDDLGTARPSPTRRISRQARRTQESSGWKYDLQ